MLDPKLKNDLARTLYGLNFDDCDPSQRQQVVIKLKNNEQTNGITFVKNTRPDIKEITAKRNEYLKELEQKQAEAAKQSDVFMERRQTWLEGKKQEQELSELYKSNRYEWAQRMKAIYLEKIEKSQNA
jgi:hypothetical protein